MAENNIDEMNQRFLSDMKAVEKAQDTGDSDYLGDSLTMYIKEVKGSGLKLLKSDEEYALGKRIKAGDIEARNELVEKNLRLVINVVKRYNSVDLTREDLIQEGNLGLIKAAEYFDPELGYKFSTYAMWWIRQAVTRAIFNSGMIRMPVYLREDMISVAKFMSKYHSEHGVDAPTEVVENFIAEKGMNRNILATINDMSFVVSLDTPVNDGGVEGDSDSTLGDFVADAQNVEQEVINSQRNELIKSILNSSSFTERERQVISLRFGLNGDQPRTLEEVGYMFGVTRERIRQIESKALLKFKNSWKVKNRLRDYA